MRPTLRHRLRLARARRRGATAGRALLGRGVEISGPVVLGDGVVVGDRCRLVGPVAIGEGSALGDACRIVAHAGVTIGRRCRFGDGVVVTDFEPVIDDVEQPVRAQGLRVDPVHVGDGATLGPGACVGRGVHIGPDAIIGAHVVVERDVPPGAVLEIADRDRRERALR